VATHSCDISYTNFEIEPYIEISVGHEISDVSGINTYGKHPRTLHLTILQKASNDFASHQKLYAAFHASKKILIPREVFLEITPCPDRVLDESQKSAYVNWLSGRYNRPTFPTEFNNRLSKVDKGEKKRRKKFKRMDENLTGIYAAIYPDTEITKDKQYSVTLMGLVLAGTSDDDLTKAGQAVKELAGLMEDAHMDIQYNTIPEDEMSVSEYRQYKRFYLDGLSFQNDTPLPIDIA
ncbi:hypothetical protein, partial [Endozoicomonas acroporae]|uniref:hypothetical protein n=1 Tax=Endozoicomonas acroporae TaxID=1701104 RepID=UPI003D79FC42